MFGNSFLKIIVIVFSVLCIMCAVFTVVFKISPIYSIILFVIALILNIIDNVVTTKSLNRDMQKLEEDMNSFKKDTLKRRK